MSSFPVLGSKSRINDFEQSMPTLSSKSMKRQLSFALLVACGTSVGISSGAAQASWNNTLIGNGVYCILKLNVAPAADDCVIGQESPNVPPAPAGDKKVTLLGYSSNAPLYADRFSLTEEITDLANPIHVDLAFAPVRGFAQNGELRYKIRVTNPLKFISGATLSNTSTNLTASDYQIEKTFWTDDTFTTAIPTLELNNPPTPVGGLNFTDQTLYIKDIWSVRPGATGSLTNIQNAFGQKFNNATVPGPVPLLGIGAAFGFSRKLRKRIKGSTQA